MVFGVNQMRVYVSAARVLLLSSVPVVFAGMQTRGSFQPTVALATDLPASRSGLSPALGWSQIPGTKLQSVCPSNGFGDSDYPFSDKCKNVVEAWGGAVADTVRNRLIVWGGGHSDYSGNEVYDVDLNTLTVNRLTDPGLPVAADCAEALRGALPNSRHTYDSLAYVPDLDAVLSFTGSLAPTGCASKAAWKLDMKKLGWTQLTPSGTPPVFNGGIAAVSYDPNRRLIFVSTESYGSFASYDFGTNSYKLLNRNAMTEAHETSVIDSKRKLFFLLGGGYAYKIDISGKDSNYSLKTIKANGCYFKNSVYPGVAFDSAQDRIVGWEGGDTVYLYNPETDSCSAVAYPNGPGAQQANGTNKRFSYFPALNVFALLNGFKEDAYVLRLTGGAPTTTSTVTSLQVSCNPSPIQVGQDTQCAANVSGEGSFSSAVTWAASVGTISSNGKFAAPDGVSEVTVTATSAQDKTKSGSKTMPVVSPQSADADNDFAARCAAVGVLKCVGWDNPSDFIQATGGGGYADGLYPGDDRVLHGTMDTSIKTSGAGSLMFTIGPNATPNATGYWRANFGPLGHLTAFGPHTTLYLQFRVRLDENMLKFKWTKVSNEGWKVFIAYGPIPGPSCTGAQFVQENTYQRNVATAYTSCGTPGLVTNNGVPPYLLEQGDYNCPYDSSAAYTSNSNCFAYPANTWITEYWIAEIGDFGQPNTHFTAYIAPQGKPLKRFIDLPKFRFNSDPEPGDAIETILLQPYMSGANGTKPNPTATMWFDELIVSTKPIAAPKY